MICCPHHTYASPLSVPFLDPHNPLYLYKFGSLPICHYVPSLLQHHVHPLYVPLQLALAFLSPSCTIYLRNIPSTRVDEEKMDMITSSSSSFAPSQPQQVSGGSHLRITAAAAANLQQPLKCPRCDSTNTKFCYYNNYSLSQPRHFCKACKRYWTRGGTLRNVPVGGGCRKNKRVKKPSPAALSPQIPPTTTSFASLPPASSAAATPSSSVNPFFYTLTGTNNMQIPQMENMGIGDYRSELSGQSMMDSFNEFQQQDCSLPTSCSILQDYSLAPKMSNIPSSSWLPLYQSLHGNAYAGNGLYREVKDEGRFDSQPAACGENQSGSVIVDGNPFWSSAVSSVWSAEPTSFFGSSTTTPLL